MPKVTTIPAALLKADDSPVQEGDILEAGKNGARQVRLCSLLPDEDGMVVVQETYRVGLDVVGLHLRPDAVIMELDRDEAMAMLAFYKNSQEHGEPTPSAGASRVLDALSGGMEEL